MPIYDGLADYHRRRFRRWFGLILTVVVVGLAIGSAVMWYMGTL